MLPSRADSRWKVLIEHPESHTYDFLALKILLGRISRSYGSMSPKDRERAIDEVFALFQKHERLMSKDIATIFS
jgi:hypothetical protein